MLANTVSHGNDSTDLSERLWRLIPSFVLVGMVVRF